MFVTHQLNAYDSPDGNIIADMVRASGNDIVFSVALV